MPTAHRPELLAYALVALIVVCATVLVALHTAIPSFFADVVLVTVGAGAGVSIPRAAVRATDPPPEP